MKKYLGAYLVIVAAYLIYLVLRIYNGGSFDWFGDLSMPLLLLVLYWSIRSTNKKNQK
jgi:ABC-type nickel/cobalt efflux system permease component RcnA